MSYPPPQGGYSPYPPNPAYPGNQNNSGFSQVNQAQGPGYPLYPPQGGGGYPSPVPGSNFGLNTQPGGPYPPPATASYPMPPSPNPPYSSQPSPYSTQASPYPNQSPCYPPQSSPNPSPYPPQCSPNQPPYPPQCNPNQSQPPYPPNAGPYPITPQASPYPPNQSPGYPGGYATASSMGQVGALQSAPGQSNFAPHQSYGQPNLQSSSAGCMWPYQERPTVRPANPFDPSSDAAQLRKAMKGFGTDEAAIIQVLGRRTSQQRQDIIIRYQQSFGKDLVKDLKGELRGDFENVIVALMTPTPLFIAQQLHNAMQGIGTKENTLIDLLCTNDNMTLRNAKAAYQATYGKPLESDLRGDTSGYFGRLMVAMAAAYRDETVNPSIAPGLAESLFKAGVKKVGTDESEFIRVMSSYSYPVLRCVFEEYKKISGGKSFDSAIKSELSGDFEDALLAVYECINNRAAFFARYLHEAMKGIGTRDEALTRIVILRSEIDMGNIKDEFLNKYGKRLEDAISSETSGDYKKILLALIQD